MQDRAILSCAKFLESPTTQYCFTSLSFYKPNPFCLIQQKSTLYKIAAFGPPPTISGSHNKAFLISDSHVKGTILFYLPTNATHMRGR